MRKIMIALLVSLCLLPGLPAGAQEAATSPQFEAATCMFTLPHEQRPDCGYVTVPENHSQPDGKTIKLAVAIFHSTHPDKATTPLIYLEGGPGGSVLELLSLSFDDRFSEFLKDRDVIVFDQRGVGRSQPALDCKEITDVILNTLDEVMSTEEMVRVSNDTLTACAQRLTDEGINLSAYNSAESAADVNDIRIALGYDKLDLYGISYGTRLALTVLRDHPEGIRSAIIDSIDPPQVSYNDAPLNFERSLGVLFKTCAADSVCNKAFPDLEQVFYDTIDQLNKEPASFKVVDPNSKKEIDAKLDGDGFAGIIFEALYATEIIPSLPKNIYDVRDGDTRFLSLWTLLKLAQLDATSVGMNYAVQCTEELPFDTVEGIQATLHKIKPQLQGFARRSGIDPSQIPMCSVWNKAKPNPIENEAVTSDIPTLVVSGEFDPITPPQYGKETAATLSNGYFFEFPGVGHGVIPSSPCALSMAQAFLIDPSTAPDASCIADMNEPVFTITAATTATIDLETFTNDTAGYTAVKPVDWKEAAPGTYARAASPLDAVAISYQVIPGGNVDLVIPLIGAQFGIDASKVIIREANGLKWRLVAGELQGIPVNMALTDLNGKVYLILLLSNTEDRDAFYEALLLPAVDAFIPVE